MLIQSPMPFKLDLNHACIHHLDDLGSTILAPRVCNNDLIGQSDALNCGTDFFHIVIPNDVSGYFLHLAVFAKYQSTNLPTPSLIGVLGLKSTHAYNSSVLAAVAGTSPICIGR